MAWGPPARGAARAAPRLPAQVIGDPPLAPPTAPTTAVINRNHPLSADSRGTVTRPPPLAAVPRHDAFQPRRATTLSHCDTNGRLNLNDSQSNNRTSPGRRHRSGRAKRSGKNPCGGWFEDVLGSNSTPSAVISRTRGAGTGPLMRPVGRTISGTTRRALETVLGRNGRAIGPFRTTPATRETSTTTATRTRPRGAQARRLAHACRLGRCHDRVRACRLA